MGNTNAKSATYYHGTSVEAAEDLLANGIREEALQTRDRGFYGDGFYITEWEDNAHDHATTVAVKNNSEPVILRVCVSEDARVLNMEPFMSGPVPETCPDFHDKFLDWVVETLESAAVWNIVSGTSREEILSRGTAERTPGSESFDGDTWRRDITRYAKDAGYDMVRWNPTEIVIVNSDTEQVRFCDYFVSQPT